MWQELKGKIQSEAPRYNKVSTTPQASTNQKIKSPPKNKNRYKVCQKHLICTPPFCDGIPKDNQNPSSKGGGDDSHLLLRQNYIHNGRLDSQIL